MASKPTAAPAKAKTAKAAPKAAKANPTAAPAPAAAQATGASHPDPLHAALAILAPLCDAHGARLEPPKTFMVIGARMLGGFAHAHHPVSVERFVEAARATMGVRDVQVMSTGIRLEVVVPAPDA